MIHYTLLPENEVSDLKREYRIRIIVVLMFFISCAMVFGIISLFPAYLTSSTRERELIGKLNLAQKSKEARKVDATLKELQFSNEILKKVQQNSSPIQISSVIQQIVSSRLQSTKFNSIQISKNADLGYEIVLQGKTNTRESLLEFKKSLESSPLFSSVQFPMPDLTKSKDISFAIKLILNKTK